MALSSFPTTVDNFPILQDVSASDKVLVDRYKELTNKAVRTVTEDIELNNLKTTLDNKMINAYKYNYLAEAITNTQLFFKDNVDGYLQIKQSEWDAILNQFTDKGNYTSSTTYQKWNTVNYDYETYISLKDGNLNYEPNTNPLWWRKIAQRGEQGIGIGLTPRGNYDNATQYQQYHAVTYGNSVYYATQPTQGNLPTNTTYWTKFLDGTVTPIQITRPTGISNGQSWIKLI